MKALRNIANSIVGLAFAFALAWAIVGLLAHLQDDEDECNNG